MNTVAIEDYLSSAVSGSEHVISVDGLQEIVLSIMSKGLCMFEYRKADGTIKSTIGTLDPALIPTKKYEDLRAMAALLKEFHDLIEDPLTMAHLDAEQKADRLDLIKKLTKGLGVFPAEPKKGRASSGTNQPYYDLNDKAWKSYSLNSLLAVYSL